MREVREVREVEGEGEAETSEVPRMAEMAMKMMVRGIRNSIQAEDARTRSRPARKRVMQCPMVKADASRVILPNFERSNDAASATKKSMWSMPLRSVMCLAPRIKSSIFILLIQGPLSLAVVTTNRE